MSVVKNSIMRLVGERIGSVARVDAVIRVLAMRSCVNAWSFSASRFPCCNRREVVQGV